MNRSVQREIQLECDSIHKSHCYLLSAPPNMPGIPKIALSLGGIPLKSTSWVLGDKPSLPTREGLNRGEQPPEA